MLNNVIRRIQDQNRRLLLYSNLMRKQNDALSESQRRLKKVYNEEEAVGKAFQIDNFYSGERLNIQELKQRIEQFKRNHSKSTPPQPSIQQQQQQPFFDLSPPRSPVWTIDQPSTAKFTNQSQNAQAFRNEQNQMVLEQIKQKLKYQHDRSVQEHLLSNRKGESDSREQRQLTPSKGWKQDAPYQTVNQYRIKETRLGRYDSKTKTAYRVKHNQTMTPSELHSRGISRMERMSGGEKTQYSKVSNSSNQKSWDGWGLEHCIKVESANELNQLEQQIHNLWEHYQLLTNILVGLRDKIQKQKNAITKYIQDVCSNRFEYVKELVDRLVKDYSISKQEAAFVRRLKRAVIMTKLLENLAIVFVGLQICLRKSVDSNLVNFVGYATSNIVFVIRFLDLCHGLQADYKYSPSTVDIINTISQFETTSYGAQLGRLGELIIRMEQNNEIMGMVQNKLANKMDKQFQQNINHFLKRVDLQGKPLLEYAHYIFEFLACYLANLNVVGQFGVIQIAPAPYLVLPKKRTIIIEPWQVLFAEKGQTTYIRAYSEIFLSEISKCCNIIYWTDLLPQRIDDLIQKLPTGFILYRYHCRYENNVFIKLLERVGCDLDNTIIIDRSEANFKYDVKMGVQLPWKGMRKDNKLLTLLDLFIPMLRDKTSLRKSFAALKPQIAATAVPSNKRFKNIGLRDVYNNGGEDEGPLPRRIGNK